MPGLLRGMARTAAVVGTAQATRGRVARRQQQRWSEQDQAQMYQQQQAYQQQYQQAPPPQPAPAPAPPPAPAPAASEDDTIAQLERLGKLKEQGILTDEEFAAQKQKILGL